jgi:lipoate---protein ligase
MSWRLFTADGVAAADGLAGDEVLAREVGAGRSPATLKLYTYRAHCALVGRFQDVANELRMSFCGDHDVQVGRRPTGGGAILMGPDQLGVALALNGKGAAHHGRPRELMARFSKGLVRALLEFGIDAGFRGKNDLEVGGRKIAGLGIYRDPSGGLLFHASLLVDLDVELMANVLRMPFESITERELRIVARRTTTVREWSAEVTVDQVRAAVAASFASSFGVELEPASPSSKELDATAALAREKYATDAWVFGKTDVRDAEGSASVDTPAGTVEVHVALAGRMLKAVHVRGDFFAADAAVADLEWRLRWHPATDAAVRSTVRAWSRNHASTDLPVDAVTQAILAAAGLATSSGEVAAPYGCFVAPGQERT